MPTAEEIAAAKVIAASPFIDAPKDSFEFWIPLARDVIEAAQDTVQNNAWESEVRLRGALERLIRAVETGVGLPEALAEAKGEINRRTSG